MNRNSVVSGTVV